MGKLLLVSVCYYLFWYQLGKYIQNFIFVWVFEDIFVFDTIWVYLLFKNLHTLVK